jgi:galactokinase
VSTRVFVPGRVEVLGKHTDYAGGSSLLVAVERGFTFSAEPLAGDRIVFVAEDSGEEARYAIERRAGSVRAVAEGADRGAHAGGESATHAPGGELARRTGGAGGGGSAGSPPVSNIGPAAGQSHGAMGRPGWARYLDGVLAHTLGEFGAAACGARVRFRSDLPAAAGLSSSSALVCGAFLALDAVCRFSDLPSFRRSLPDRAALAGFLSAAEMGGPVGTRGGSEDHVAILCAEPGRVVRYGLAPIRARGAVAVPAGWTFAVAASGVVADKGGAVQAHYNRLSDLASGAARAWAAGAGPTGIDTVGEARAFASADATRRSFNLGDARARTGDTDSILAAIRAGAVAVGEDPVPLVRRARHFLEECALVDAAFEALERGDVGAFAGAANRSATVGHELLENQVPETLRLTALARALGAPAASPFGGGFGGAVWALIRAVDADRFIAEWRERYQAAFPHRTGAEFFRTRAGPAAGRAG